MLEADFRPLRAENLAEIYEIERASFRTPWSREELAGDLANPISRYVGCYVGGALAGYAAFWLLMEEAHVTNVAVKAEYRRMGLGEGMMKALIQLAADSGARFMELECRRSNDAAIKMYHKLGFLRVGCRKGYYADTGEDAVIMALIAMPPAHYENDPFLIEE